MEQQKLLGKTITGVCVNFRTPLLLKKAIDSIRKFYDFPIIVIDGSEENCDNHSESHLNHSNITVIHTGHNIGHGLGMDMGIKMAETDYVLTFDTDIEMKKPCIEEMLERMKEDTYAIGKLYINTPKPYFYIENEELFDQLIVNTYVIHPSFQIVSKKEYLKYAPYISDGAPTVLSYHDIMRHNKEKEILIDFPVLDYVEHKNSGTRDITLKHTDYENNIHWKYKWKEYIEANPV